MKKAKEKGIPTSWFNMRYNEKVVSKKVKTSASHSVIPISEIYIIGFDIGVSVDDDVNNSNDKEITTAQ